MESSGPHRRARINYCIRTVAFAYCFIVLAIHGWERSMGSVFWLLLVAQFLVYPHFQYLRARYSNDSRRAEEGNLYIDATLLGAWIAGLHFPTWILYAALFATSLNAIVVGGVLGLLWSLGCFGAAAAFFVAAFGVGYQPQTSGIVTLLCVAGSLAYTCGVGYVVYLQNRRLATARDELRESEERYRLIAENAGDLIAVVDQGGRWLYTSPSYARVIESKIGDDAFRSAHPDDAERARVALLRAAATGKPREVPLRLVDREGRIRQYRVRLQALGKERPAERLVLVSQDVTDLRESEERLLVAAHALEGMTEAIMICAADGTIVTVNRAFSEITGYSKDDVVGQPEREFRHALQPAEYYQEIYATIERDGYWSGTTWTRRKNGAVYREWRSIRALRDPGGTVTHYVMVFFEVGTGGKTATDTSTPRLRG